MSTHRVPLFRADIGPQGWCCRRWFVRSTEGLLDFVFMYLRFVRGSESEDGRWLTGVITAARVLRDVGELEPYQVEIVNSTYDWLNEHIPCPPFRENLESGKWTNDAVAWFLPEANEAIQRMWDLVHVLKDHGVPIRLLRTANPGIIVYRDEYQVVAETPKRRRADG